MTRRALDDDFNEELRAHLGFLIEEYRAAGLPPADARRAALHKLGHPALLREVHREQRGLPLFDALAQDARYAMRSIVRRPGFAIVAVLSLALGIGASTALFTVIDSLLLRNLAVREPERLVQVDRVFVGMGMRKGGMLPDKAFEALRANSSLLQDVVGFNRRYRPLVAIDGPTYATAEVDEVSANFFRDLGVAPVIGRAPDPSESGVAIISNAFWRTQFGGRADAIGRTVTIDAQAYVVIGVAPREFTGILIDTATDIWVAPSAFRNGWMLARLAPGVTPVQAAAALQSLFEGAGLDPAGAPPMQTEVTPAGRGLSAYNLRTQYGRALLALAVLVALLLLITCANVGNLLVLRNLTRRRELSVRVALGASRGRVVMHYLVESVLLALAGAVLALALAHWGVSLLLSMLPLPAVPDSLVFHLDARTLAFAAAVTALSAALFAVVPAWRATMVDVGADLKSTPGSGHLRNQRRWSHVLVAGQVALSVLLLGSAGLFVQTLRNLARSDVGFDPVNLIQVSIDTRGAGYGEGQVGPVHAVLLERVAAIPGVESVTSARNPLMQGTFARTRFQMMNGRVLGPDEAWESADVGPSFFETMRLGLVRGRTFTDADFARTTRRPIIINEAFARKYFPGDDPIGKEGGTIVGIVRDAKLANVRQDIGPMMYFPLPQEPDRVSSLQIRTRQDLAGIVSATREAINAVHPRLLLDIRSMQGEIDRMNARERLVAGISAFFSMLALLLVSIGIFGVAAYSVAQRTRELGIRMALGANHWSVIRESLRDTIWVFCTGLTVGTLVTVAAAQLAASLVSDLLFGLTATDAANITAAVVVMVAVALAAAFLPARRATRIDPLVAIRHD